MDPSSSIFIKRKRDSDSDDELEQPNSKRFKNDVSLNYESKDIGKSLISHLLRSLKHSGFEISDYSNLRVGHDARLEVFKAIDDSEISLVVFSPNYASCKECLDELVHIMDCVARNPDQRKVLPVFYNVEPSDVRNQSGHFKESFEAHETSTDPKILQKWKQALKDVGQLSGLPFKDFRDEAELISEIVNHLGKMLTPRDMHVTDHPVGIRSRSEELISELRLDCENVLVVGVFGFSGMGKTAIVKDMHNKIASQFEASCFLEDIHRRCHGKGDWKFELQEDLISQLSKDDKVKLRFDGVVKIQNLIRRKKTLLVLDDVQNFEQLEGLGINPVLFHKGSRIIVTTRNQESLGGIPHTSYHTKLLNERESRKLFIQHMFARDEPVQTELVEEVVARSGGLPLVLKVWSRYFTQYKEHLPAALKKLKQIPHGDVQKQLQMSYDSLSPEAKNLFLDIACFFDGMQKDLVIKVLNDEDFGVDYEIEKLARRFLVENQGSYVSLPHVIKEMGHEVVRQEHPEDPGQRTRLMVRRDVVRVFRENSGTDSVRSIQLDYNDMEEEAIVQFEAFRKMSGLRFIQLINSNLQWSSSSNDDMSVCFSFKHLKYLECHDFPSKSLDNIDMGNVVFIRLYGSKLETLWEGLKSCKKLKILNVGFSSSLTKTGDFIGLDNLEELLLEKCENLVELDSSVGCLQKLVELDLSRCKQLKSLPWEMIEKLTSLQKLNLENCHNLLEISHKVGSLLSLKQLHLSYNRFSILPNSLSQLNQLTEIKLKECTNLKSIPDLPPSISALYVDGCTNLKSIPDLPPTIEDLRVTDCINLVNLPSNFSELQFLTILTLKDCVKLRSESFTQVTRQRNLCALTMKNCNVSKVSSRIGNLVSLISLDLSENTFSSLPGSFRNLSRMEFLTIKDCSQLKFLPPPPSQLRHIEASNCSSLNLMKFDPMRKAYTFPSKVFKESLIGTEGLYIGLSGEKLPEWCTYQKSESVLSFEVPIQFDSKICGLVLSATRDNKDDDYEDDEYEDYEDQEWVCPTIYNKTKGIIHRFFDCGNGRVSMMVMFCPLNDSTLVVAPGDTLELQFDDEGKFRSCGLRLVYEDDDDDNDDDDDDDDDDDLGLVFRNVTKPTLPFFPSLETGPSHVFRGACALLRNRPWNNVY